LFALSYTLKDRFFQPGEKLFREGDRIGEIYLLRAGEVKISNSSAGKKFVKSEGQRNKRDVRVRSPNVDLELVFPQGVVGDVDMVQGRAMYSVEAVAVCETKAFGKIVTSMFAHMI
jgi:CRP-like cAMP-binding protein